MEANFNNDIIGNIQGGGNGLIDGESVRVYSLGPEDSMNRALARYIQRVAASPIYVPSHTDPPHGARGPLRPRQRPLLVHVVRLSGRGVPRGERELLARQHTANDTLGGVNFAYLAQNARVNAAGGGVGRPRAASAENGHRT